MCGIYGFSWPSKIISEIMSNSLKHRGPDDLGDYQNENITLGHRRLSIIDLSKNGKQPMHNENKKIWITYNGEVYNYKELKKDLLKKGHKFYSNSDTEVLIHLYEEEGIKFINKLNGMFAFALWDDNLKKLFIARDKAGIKPLYYSFIKGDIIFASEIKAIINTNLVDRDVDKEALEMFMFYRYIPSRKTIFQNINKLLPGDVLEFKNNKAFVKNYGINYHGEFNKLSKEKTIEQINSEILKSVKYRLIADVPIGSFLSGGIDSSTITALAQKNTKNKVNSYSVEFDLNDIIIKSEIKYAEELSKAFNIQNHKLIVKEDMVLNKLPTIAWHYDEPMGDAAVIPTYFISEIAKKKVKVVLAGEGGDEQFCGYTKYEEMINLFERYPDMMPDELASEYMKKVSVFMPEQMEKLFKRFNKFEFENKTIEQIKPQFEFITKDNILTKMLAFDQKTMLCENYLMKADKMSMAHGLEERVPFLDINVLNFTATIRNKLKLKNGTEKYILKESLKELLPKNIIRRKKMGYGTPTKDWFRNNLGSIFEKRISNSKAFRKYFDVEYIKELYYTHKLCKANNNTKLWNLLAFDLWYKIYIENKGINPEKSYQEYLLLN